MSESRTPPAIDSNLFDCPHCGELSDQAWFNAYAEPITAGPRIPLRIDEDDLERLRTNPMIPQARRDKAVPYWRKVIDGEVFIDRWAPAETDLFVANLTISACYQCGRPAVWIGEHIVWPA